MRAPMHRRSFLTLLGSAAAAWPVGAGAQQRVPVIGFLSPGSPDMRRVPLESIRRGLADNGFVEGRNVLNLATYAMWWIRAAIQEYILRSWSLVKMGTTASQKKLFFNLRKAKSKIAALQEGDLRPDQVQIIAKRLGVTDKDVIDMNRRLGGDASLNAPISTVRASSSRARRIHRTDPAGMTRLDKALRG
jgi:hypothetical protein